MHADCMRLILEGLHEWLPPAHLQQDLTLFSGAILNLKNIGMNYLKYERDIIMKYKVNS